MNPSSQKKTIRDLIKESKYSDALLLIKRACEELDKHSNDYYSYALLKIEILELSSQYELAIDFIDKDIDLGKIPSLTLRIEILMKMASILYRMNELGQGLLLVDSIEDLISSGVKKDFDLVAFHKFSIQTNSLKGLMYLNTEDLDIAFQYLTQGMDHTVLLESMIAPEVYRGSELYSSVLLEKSVISNAMGMVYFFKGQLEKALDYYAEALKLKLELDNDLQIAISHNNIGYTYYVMGTYDVSIQFLKRALELTRKIENHYLSATAMFNLLRNYIQMKDSEKIDVISMELENIAQMQTNTKNIRIQSAYKLAQALRLISTNKVRDKFLAEDILRELISGKFEVQFVVIALVHLTEIYLLEARLTEDEKILNKIKELISSLDLIALKQKSDNLKIHVDMLLAKYEIITGNYEEAGNLYSQALELASSKGMTLLMNSIKKQVQHLHSEFSRLSKIVSKNQNIGDAIRNADILDYIEDIKKMI